MTVLHAYRGAWARRSLIVPVMLGLRLLALAVVTPLAGMLVNWAVALSGQPALTDQAIAAALASPAGILVALLVGGALLITSVIGLAAMTLDLRAHGPEGLAALPAALRLIAARLPRLLAYAVALLLRVLLLVAPFALIGVFAAERLLGAYDINYYLSTRTPEFRLAVGLGLVLGAVLLGLLLTRLLAWAISLHLVLFDGISPRRAFAQSRAEMVGHRRRLLGHLGLWFAIRLGLSALVGGVFGALMIALPGALGGGINRQIAVAVGIALLWSFAGLLISALSLGALARILDGHHRRGHPEPVAFPDRAPPQRPALIMAGMAVLILLGVLASGRLLDQVAMDRDVLVIGHRGAAAHRPENSMASIEKAVEDGADWVEIDVQENADGAVVVVHDSDFMKLAGVDLKVWDATAADLAQIDIGSSFDPAFSDQRVPSLADALDAVRDRAVLLIELKYYGHDQALEAKVADLVAAAGMEDQVAVMSLKVPGVAKMRALRPDWPAGILAATGIGDLAALDADFLAVNTGLAGPRLLRSAHGAGKKLFVWTVNDPLQMAAMIAMGVDGLITDDPALARQVLAEYAELPASERLFALVLQRMGLTGWDPDLGGEDRP